MSRSITLMSCVLCVALGSVAFASPVSYTSFAANFGSTIPDSVPAARASWLDEVGIVAPANTVDFETGFTVNQTILGQELDGGITITSNTGGYGYVTSSAAAMGGTAPFGTYALAVDEGDRYVFDFSSPISYLGFILIDNGTTGMTINYVDGTTDSATILGGFSGGVGGSFLGLVFDKDVSSIVIPQIEPGPGQAGLDNIEFGYISVPEPMTLSLIVFGVLSLLLVRRRRS